MAAVLVRGDAGAEWRLTREGVALAGLFTLLGVALGALLFLPPVAQKAAYHHFHDARMFLGIPNAGNVLSNLPFAIVGMLGLAHLRRHGEPAMPELLVRAWTILFVGITATAFGSALYHWSPNDRTLILDRLPMAVAFMALFAVVLGERIGTRVAGVAFWPLIGLGIASVLYWAIFDDLRPYGVVQFYPLLAIPILLAGFPRRDQGTGHLLAALACYIAAKLFEQADAGIMDLLSGAVSGHTLKHLMAGAGAWCVYRMLASRPVAD